MRLTQKVAVGLLLLGISAGVSPTHAAPAHPSAGPAGSVARGILDPLWSLLVAAWGRTSCHIDPYGRCLPAQEPTGTAAPPAGASPDTRGDTSCHIDPFGGCPAGR